MDEDGDKGLLAAQMAEIDDLCARAGMSRTALATAAGIQGSTINKRFTGKVTGPIKETTMRKLRKAAEIPPEKRSNAVQNPISEQKAAYNDKDEAPKTGGATVPETKAFAVLRSIRSLPSPLRREVIMAAADADGLEIVDPAVHPRHRA